MYYAYLARAQLYARSALTNERGHERRRTEPWKRSSGDHWSPSRTPDIVIARFRSLIALHVSQCGRADIVHAFFSPAIRAHELKPVFVLNAEIPSSRER